MNTAGMNAEVTQLLDWLAVTGMQALTSVLMAAAILVIGLYAAGFISKRVRAWGIAHPRIDSTLAVFFSSIVKYIIMAVVIIAVLTRFGVETTSLVAALGAMTLAVGLALQGTLANVAAGVMIVFFRPYRVGDFVDISGTAGTVKDINLFLTELSTPDNKQIIVPNGQAWGNVITNFSSYPTRRVDFTFSVDYDTDLELAREVIRQVLEADARIHKDPAVFVELGSFADSSIDFFARVWVNASDYWDVHWDANRRMKLAFDAAGISIPFPHRVMVEKADMAPAKPSAARSKTVIAAAAKAVRAAAALTQVAVEDASPSPEPAPEPAAAKTARKPRVASAAKTGAAASSADGKGKTTRAPATGRKPSGAKQPRKPRSDT
ncbi:mechanosensitive ion channel [Hyphomonadaceae bacterium BL14]|nr:mechanosensitive ion channel [Hyphomonadaceae bacterium BL14]